MSLPRLIPLLCLLTACADYRFSVNERVVYNPDPLFRAYEIPDPQLRACVAGYIEREKISSAAELRELECPNAGIVRLQGLQVFVNLGYLDLSGNSELSCDDLKLPGVPVGAGLVVPEHCPEP